MYLDGLPAAVQIRDPETTEISTNFQSGIPIGKISETDGSVIIYNHLHINVKYHNKDEKKMQVVSFEIEPRSIAAEEFVRWSYY